MTQTEKQTGNTTDKPQSLDDIKADMENYLATKAHQTEIIKQQKFLKSLPYKED